MTYDAGSIDAVVGDGDVLQLDKLGLKVCAECHHPFDPKTGKLAKGFETVFIVRPVDPDKTCKGCADLYKAWPKR